MNEQNFSIIRCENAGVFFGKVAERSGSEAVIRECRRLWCWSGAASLSQLAMEGVKNPGKSKFTVTVPEITVLGVIEIIPCTEEAVQNIQAVPEWKIR